MDLFENNFIYQGGVMMYPLLLISLLGFILFIERALYLHRGQIETADFLAGIKNLVRKGRRIEALTLCEDTPGPMARIVKSALLHYGESREAIRSAIQSAAIVEMPPLERRIGTIAALARVAPLVGFLGTLVAGLQILYSLESLNSDSGLLGRYLAQALITSAVGLAIGVMAMLAFHFLAGRVRALVHELEWLGHEIHEFLCFDKTHATGETTVEESNE